MFITDANETAALSASVKEFVIGEEIRSADFCGSGPMHCVSTEYFTFYVPKNIKGTQWSGAGKIFCVIRSFDAKAQEVLNGDLLVIISPASGKCEIPGEYSQYFLYSRTSGLRFIKVANSGIDIRLVSLDRLGFGSKTP